MKKFPVVLLSCSMLWTMTGCLSDQASITNKPSSNAALYDIYQHNYSVSLFKFGNITKLLSQANNQNDLTYVNGYIDSYLIEVPNLIPRIISEDEGTYNRLVVTKLQADIDKLFVDIGEYTQYLQGLVEKNDVETIKTLRPELERLHEIERKLNDDMYSKIEEVDRYQEKLRELHSLIQSRLKK